MNDASSPRMPAHPTLPLDPTLHPTWSAHRFFWAWVDLSPQRAASLSPRRLSRLARRTAPFTDQPHLDALLADDVPCDPTLLHVVYIPVHTPDQHSLLACALPLADLDALPPATLSLMPQTYPAAVPLCPAHPPPNLLIGSRTPQPVRAQSRSRARRRSLLVLTLAVLLAVGLVRRAHHNHADAARLAAAAQQLAARAGVHSPSTNAPDLQRQLAAHLHTLAHTRAAPPANTATAAHHLHTFLAHWPAVTFDELHAHTLTTTPTHLTLTLATPQPQAAHDLIRALRPPPGWSFSTPQLTTTPSATLLRLSATPPAAPATAASR